MNEETKEHVLQWLADGNVGGSSKCLAMWIAFGKATKDRHHPRDPGEMDRCFKLLNRAPGLREHLHMMAGISREWAAIVKRWDEIEAMQMEEVGLNWWKALSAPKTYDLMRKIIKEANNGR